MKSKGFTLLELMVVILIIGIISSLAYSSFTTSVIRAEIDSSAKQFQSYLKYMTAKAKQNSTRFNSIKVLDSTYFEYETPACANPSVANFNITSSSRHITITTTCTGIVTTNNWSDGCIDLSQGFGGLVEEGCLVIQSTETPYKVAVAKKSTDTRFILFDNRSGAWVEQ